MQNKYNDLVNFIIWIYPQGLGASEKKIIIKILYNTTRGRTHLLPFFLSRRVKLIVTSERLNIFKKCFHQSKVK